MHEAPLSFFRRWFLFCACGNQVDVFPSRKVAEPEERGDLQEGAGGTVHHLGDEHRRTGAETTIPLFLLVLLVVAIEVMTLRPNIFYDDVTTHLSKLQT